MLADAVLLAAGKSTRIGSIGGGVPKPLLQIDGEPILVRNVRWLAAAGVRRLFVNLHHRGDLIRGALGDGRRWGVDIRYSEEPTILGTAGAVRKLLPHFGPRFLVVYGDNLVSLDLEAFVAAHIERRADVTIAVFDEQTPNTGMAGGRVVVGPDDVVESFLEGERGERRASPPLVNAAVYAVEASVLESFPAEQFLDWGRDIFPVLLTQGAELRAYRVDGYCLGLDTPASYERGLALINSGRVRLQ